MKNKLLLAACILLSGCSWIGRQADALGDHMPVIGERCEHWQCMTESGQAQSDYYKQQKAEADKAEAEKAKQELESRPPIAGGPPPADNTAH